MLEEFARVVQYRCHRLLRDACGVFEEDLRFLDDREVIGVVLLEQVFDLTPDKPELIIDRVRDPEDDFLG